eukprot:650283-Alexandrium_andersonii.AAC.1
MAVQEVLWDRRGGSPESTATCSRLQPWNSGLSLAEPSSGASTSDSAGSSKRERASEQDH